MTVQLKITRDFLKRKEKKKPLRQFISIAFIIALRNSLTVNENLDAVEKISFIRIQTTGYSAKREKH